MFQEKLRNMDFNSRISNYRVFASIYKLFSTENISLSPDVETDSRYTVIEHITQRKITSKEKKVFSEEFKGQDDDLRLLSYQILVDKFNQKYSSLNSAQRKLLKEYINNVSNTNSLREYVDSEVSKVTKVLKTYLPKIEDKIGTPLSPYAITKYTNELYAENFANKNLPLTNNPHNQYIEMWIYLRTTKSTNMVIFVICHFIPISP